MLLYLDLNCFNRPFDDPAQERVARETAAVFQVLRRIVDGTDRLAWSEVLDLENSQHPLADRRAEIGTWAKRAPVRVRIDEALAARAEELAAFALAPLDAAHLACAEAASCDAFLTCDDRLIRRSARAGLKVQVLTPVEYLEGYDHG
jgi:predicted nucleic acid-binding protein